MSARGSRDIGKTYTRNFLPANDITQKLVLGIVIDNSIVHKVDILQIVVLQDHNASTVRRSGIASDFRRSRAQGHFS